MKSVKVLFFATLKDRAGEPQSNLEIPDSARVSDLKQLLSGRYPALVEMLPSALVAINREFAFDEDAIPDGAEIALFPPVSGGVH